MAIVTALIIAADLATKWVAQRELEYGGSIWALEGIVGLELIRNRGTAFGLFEGRWFTLALILVAVLALVRLLTASNTAQSPTGVVGAGAMLGGAIGNLIDRLPDGSVTDFIAVGPWPRFNLADTALTTGLVLVIGRQLLPSSSSTLSIMGKS